jgi:hypothetical protein
MGRRRWSAQDVNRRVKFLYLLLFLLHPGSWMPARRFVLLAAVAVPLLLPGVARAQSQPSMESQVFAKINAARSKKLIFHGGVHSVAWRHSADMASRGGLSHANADARISNAPPDPAEANGAPDDGYGRDWCENVTYVNFGTEAEAPGKIYEAWRRSGAHQRCMQDTTLNTGAVGIYWDGNTWWATFIAYLDHTPPGAPAPAAPVAPKPKPVATTPPTVAPAPNQTTTVPVPEGPAPGTGRSSNTGSVQETQPAESAAPSAEPDGDRILVITEPAAKASQRAGAGTENLGDVLFAAVTKPKLGVQEVAAAAGALFLGFLLALLRLKQRHGLPRTMRTPAQKVDKDAASTTRIPIAGHSSGELAGAAQRQRELVRS